MVTHHPLTSLCWAQKQIQVSMGGGRDQHLVSSVSVWQPRRNMKGAICTCISIWGMLRAERSRQLTQRGRRGRGAWIRHIPLPCAACWHFSAMLGNPGKALNGCAGLLRLLQLFCLSSFTFRLRFLSQLEGIVLISLFTSLPFVSVILSFLFLLSTNKPFLCCNKVWCWFFAVVHHSVTQTLRTRCYSTDMGPGVWLAHTLVTLHSARTSLSFCIEPIWWQKETS